MVDYSKWKDIEISDDEDDTHPNVDTPSLFRWRHQARVERMEEQEKKKAELEKKEREYEKKIAEEKKKLEGSGVDLAEMKKAISQLEDSKDKLRVERQDFEKKSKLEPWNVDTISQPGFSKTIINKSASLNNDNLTEEEKEEKMRKFIAKNEALIKGYGMFRNYDDSRRYMMENPELACEETANYLVIWCINLQMEEKTELMAHVAHQTICVQFILELAKQLERDPRSCISAFFHRIQTAEAEYKQVFSDELESFKTRIKNRAKEKLEEAYREIEEEEKAARLGPGGLDPLEVIETLPQVLKDCFESQSIDQLKDVIANMDKEEATYHMKRCVDSGLWVPEAGASKDGVEDENVDDENVYETVDDKKE